MGTIVAVKKSGLAYIGTNCLCTRDPLVKPSLTSGHDCIFHIGDSLVAIHSYLAFQQAFETLVVRNQRELTIDLSSRSAIHSFFVGVHGALKNQSFMHTQFQPQQDFEWSPMTAIVLNKHGLFKVDSARGVFELSKFWAMGTGENFSLGAMHTQYESDKDAKEIVKSGLLAAQEFSTADNGDIRIIPLPTTPEAHRLTLPDEIKSTKRRGSGKKKDAAETIN